MSKRYLSLNRNCFMGLAAIVLSTLAVGCQKTTSPQPNVASSPKAESGTAGATRPHSNAERVRAEAQQMREEDTK